jgi:flavin reductase (DIM6/NTAB) family NADH-FMN oxidoreductase RutF
LWPALSDCQPQLRRAALYRECVIAIPDQKLASTVVQVGNSPGRNIDKFAAFGLTPVPAERVVPPLVAERFANIECRVTDAKLVKKLQSLHSRCRQSVGGPCAEQR